MPVHVKREPTVCWSCLSVMARSPHAGGAEQSCLFAVRLLIDYRALRVAQPLNGVGGDGRLSNRVH
jgi:hypothetical protein